MGRLWRHLLSRQWRPVRSCHRCLGSLVDDQCPGAPRAANRRLDRRHDDRVGWRGAKDGEFRRSLRSSERYLAGDIADRCSVATLSSHRGLDWEADGRMGRLCPHGERAVRHRWEVRPGGGLLEPYVHDERSVASPLSLRDLDGKHHGRVGWCVPVPIEYGRTLRAGDRHLDAHFDVPNGAPGPHQYLEDRKSTRLNSSHLVISYAV